MNKQAMKQYFQFILDEPLHYTVTFDPLLGWMLDKAGGNYSFSINRKFAMFLIDYYYRNFPSTCKYFN